MRRPPFQELSPFEAVFKASRENLRPELPKNCILADILGKCWDPSPDRRPEFDEIIDVISELENFVGKFSPNEKEEKEDDEEELVENYRKAAEITHRTLKFSINRKSIRNSAHSSNSSENLPKPDPPVDHSSLLANFNNNNGHNKINNNNNNHNSKNNNNNHNNNNGHDKTNNQNINNNSPRNNSKINNMVSSYNNNNNNNNNNNSSINMNNNNINKLIDPKNKSSSLPEMQRGKSNENNAPISGSQSPISPRGILSGSQSPISPRGVLSGSSNNNLRLNVQRSKISIGVRTPSSSHLENMQINNNNNNILSPRSTTGNIIITEIKSE